MVKLILRAVAGCVFLWSFGRNEGDGPDSRHASQDKSHLDNASGRQAANNAGKRESDAATYFSKPKNLVALATLVAVCIYTGITGCQYNYTVVSSRQQLRAYVGTPAGTYRLICQGCVPRPDGTANGTYEIGMSVKNFGATPAMTPRTCAQPVFIEHAGGVTRGDLDRVQQRCVRQDVGSGGQTTIWPGDTVPIEVPFGPDDAITRSRHGLSRAFVLGYTTYTDIFGSHHTSWYCTQYKRDSQQDVFTGCDRTNLPADL